MVVIGRLLCTIQYGVRAVPEVYVEYEGEEVSVILDDVEWEVVRVDGSMDSLPSPVTSDDDMNDGTLGRFISMNAGGAPAAAEPTGRSKNPSEEGGAAKGPRKTSE